MAQPPRAAVDTAGMQLTRPQSPAWLQGPAIVVPRIACIDRCYIRCGAPSTETRRQSLRWQPTDYTWTIALGLLPYLIATSVNQQTAEIDVGLCATHARRFHRQRWLGAGGAVGAAALLLGAMLGGLAWPALISLALGVAAFVHGGRLVRTGRIDPYYAWLLGASPAVATPPPPMWPAAMTAHHPAGGSWPPHAPPP